MASKGTAHHRLKGLTGLVMIIGLPFILFYAVSAIGLNIPETPALGFIKWLATPLAGLGLVAFFAAAVWYCKLEFDEVIMDYFDGGLRSFALLANKVVPFLAWAAVTYSVLKLSFLG